MDSLPPAHEGPLSAYRARVAEGSLRADPAQAHAAETLQNLWRILKGYDPQPAAPGPRGLFGRIFAKLGVRDRAGAIVYAFDHGVVAPSG